MSKVTTSYASYADSATCDHLVSFVLPVIPKNSIAIPRSSSHPSSCLRNCNVKLSVDDHEVIDYSELNFLSAYEPNRPADVGEVLTPAEEKEREEDNRNMMQSLQWELWNHLDPSFSERAQQPQLEQPEEQRVNRSKNDTLDTTVENSLSPEAEAEADVDAEAEEDEDEDEDAVDVDYTTLRDPNTWNIKEFLKASTSPVYQGQCCYADAEEEEVVQSSSNLCEFALSKLDDICFNGGDNNNTRHTLNTFFSSNINTINTDTTFNFSRQNSGSISENLQNIESSLHTTACKVVEAVEYVSGGNETKNSFPNYNVSSQGGNHGKNAYLHAMTKKAKEDFAKDVETKNRRQNKLQKQGQFNRQQHRYVSAPNIYTNKPTPSFNGDRKDNFYNDFNAVEKTMFLRLVKSGFTPKEAMQRIRQRKGINENKALSMTVDYRTTTKMNSHRHGQNEPKAIYQ